MGAASSTPVIAPPVWWGKNSLFFDAGLERNLPISALCNDRFGTVLALNVICCSSSEAVDKHPQRFSEFLIATMSILKESTQEIHGLETITPAARVLREADVDVVNIDVGTCSPLRTDVTRDEFERM